MDKTKVVEFLNQLGISLEGQEQDGKYVIDLGDSNSYSKIYTILDKSELVDLDVENIMMDEHTSQMLYLSDDFDVTLEANLDDGVYKLVIEEAKD